MAEKMELDFEEMDNVTGGKSVKQNNKNKKSNQQNNVNGDNNNDVTQINYVKGNSGNVKVGSPVSIKDFKNSTINVNL